MRRQDVEYVYTVRLWGMFKIGHTWDPERRIGGLLPTLKAPDVVSLTRYPWPHASRVERAMQKHFLADRVDECGREWFRWTRTTRRRIVAFLKETPMSKRQIGADLLAARIRHEATQAQVADSLGISQEMIAMVERGTKDPSPSLAKRIQAWISHGHADGAAPRGPRGSYDKVAKRVRARAKS